MKILLAAIALCSTCYYGAVINFDSPKQQLFVLNQKINIIHQLLNAECPHYVNKRNFDSADEVLLRIELAERLFTKLLGELGRCRQKTSIGMSQTPARSAAVDTTTTTAAQSVVITKHATTTNNPLTETTKRTSEATTLTSGRVAYIDCQDYYEQGYSISGVYEIDPLNSKLLPFNVWCDFADGHGWTVIQRRTDATSFYKSWDEYKNGFGALNGPHWLGNDKIHLLTQTNQKLNISLVASDGEERWAAYSLFRVADEADKYRLTISGDNYSGTLRDKLSKTHNGKMFTTRDNDNDLNQSGNCAIDYKGGWWYRFCSSADLNASDLSGMYWGDGLWDFELSIMRVGRD